MNHRHRKPGQDAPLTLPLALLYAKALDAKDRGDFKSARALSKLLKQAPGSDSPTRIGGTH